MIGVFYASYVALWLLVLVQAVLLLVVYRHFGLMAMGTVGGVNRDGLRVGDRARPITGVTASGDRSTWTPTPGRVYLLAFVSPGCAPCVGILPHIVRLGEKTSDLGVALAVSGARESVAQLVERFQPPSSIVCLAEDPAKDAADQPYHVRVVPFAFLIGEDGRILAKGLCDKPSRLRRLLAAAGLEGTVPSRDLPVLSQVG